MVDTMDPHARPGVAASPKLLRELDDGEFAERYDCDRFTATLLANRFRYLIEHICGQLLTNAFSPILRDATDFAATISGPPSLGYAMPAVSQTIPVFFGSIPDAVRVAVEEYGPARLRPGDIIIVNDPYRVGTHINDVSFIRPVHLADELVGFITITAHMLDWGGRVMGGFEATKTSIYEDGLVLPPMALYEAGQPVRSTFSLICDNTRFGAMVLPDVQTIRHSLELGERLLLETIDKYGLDAYLGSIRYACDASAETMRVALHSLPDGDYTGEETIDGDGLPDSDEYVIRVRLIKRGGHAEFDFSGSSPSTRSALNCTWADAKTAIAIALKFLIDPTTPFTSGALRDVDVLIPPGSIVNALPPTCCMFYWEPIYGIIYAIFRALNPVLGDRAIAPDAWGSIIHHAHGVTPDGQPWYSHAGGSITPTNPWGATRQGDADTNQVMYFLNLLDMGIEQAEAGSPVVVLRKDLLPDSGGPGRHRGGAAGLADSLWLSAAEHRGFQPHIRRPPADGGVYGGRPGLVGGGWLWNPDNTDLVGEPGFLPATAGGAIYREAEPLTGMLDTDTHELDPAGRYHVFSDGRNAPAGSVVRFIGNGGGGWGDPFEREPDLVRRDVRDEYVSVEGAARDYGVVVVGDPAHDPEGLTVDHVATARLRAAPRRPTRSYAS
jgi:N-methylhydantoinase B